MNKFKKILLGTLSVLTLGLFVTTSVKVNAEDMNFVFDTASITANTLELTNGTAGTQLKDSMFYVVDTNLNKKIEYKTQSATISGESYSYGLYLNYTEVSENRNLFFEAPCAGKIKLLAYCSKSNKVVNLYNSSFNKIDSCEIQTTKVLTDDNYTYLNISEAGKYFISQSNPAYYYHIEFMPEKVTALQQEAKVGDYTLVRFIFIISNATDIDSYDFTDALALCLDAEKTDGPVVHRTPNVYTKLTSNGKAYSAEVKGNQYTFDNSVNENDVYVVYIVKFTTAKYLEHNISADLEYKTGTYSTTPYTFE